MDNNIYCKTIYKCGICATEYDNVVDRANCELACTKKAEKVKKEAEYAKKMAEKEARRKELDESIDTTNKLLRAYMRDYGSYEVSCVMDKLNDKYMWPSKILHNFI